MEERPHDEYVLEVVRSQPYPEGLRREAPIAHGNVARPPRPEHPRYLVEHLLRLVEVVDAHHARHRVEAIVRIWENRILVQVPHNVRREPLVLAELVLVHAEPHDVPALPIPGIVTDPRAAHVQDVVPVLEVIGVVLGQSGYGVLVDVIHETRLAVEERVVALVLPLEVDGAVRPLGGVFRIP